VNSGGNFNFNSGTLLVDNFTGDLINNRGSLEPGTSPGITNIIGNYTQSPAGNYAVEIGGIIQEDEYDFLNVTGTANLGGTLGVTLLDLGSGPFSPSLGDSFDILVASNIIGQFDILKLPDPGNGLGWDVDYLNNGSSVVRLKVAMQVPIDIEPSKETTSTINFKKNNLKVAILTDGSFSADTVNPSTVRFGPAEATPTRSQLKDVDRDGDDDLLVTFGTNDTGIVCGDTSANLTGETYSGDPIIGTDSFVSKGC
jgi:hypothetical protein